MSFPDSYVVVLLWVLISFHFLQLLFAAKLLLSSKIKILTVSIHADIGVYFIVLVPCFIFCGFVSLLIESFVLFRFHSESLGGHR